MKMFLVICAFFMGLGQACAAPQKVDLSTLAGYTFKKGELYADLLGVSGVIPSSATIDFDLNLKRMWEKKLGRKKGVTDVAEATAEQVVAYYSTHKTKMTLRDYVKWVNADVEAMKKHIDWVGFCGVRLQGDRCRLLQELADGIYGKDLVAYGLTELMPSANGKLNVLLLDVLLRNAGREYLDSVPALYDKYTSLGAWQFTQFAIFHTGSEVRGASHVNLYVKRNYKIPGSVTMLRNRDHHRAAFLFAISNLHDLVRKMNSKELANLSRGHEKHLDEIVQFIATAHHLPGHAIAGARRWAANNMKKEFRVSLGVSLSKYANKTENNLLELYKRIK